MKGRDRAEKPKMGQRPRCRHNILCPAKKAGRIFYEILTPSTVVPRSKLCYNKAERF